MKVLIIPEDFRKDQYILKPIIQAMFASLGKVKAKVEVCKNPLLMGISQALNWDNVKKIITMYPMVDIFLLCVDRDCNEPRRKILDKLEEQTKSLLNKEQSFFAEQAWQELEVWILAGHTLPNDWNWKQIRQECNPKETYYLPFAKQQGVEKMLANGRQKLGLEAAKNYPRLCQLCPEDIANLETRLKTKLP